MDPVTRLLERLDSAKKNGGGWQARCPAHEDRNPSLSVWNGRDGRAMLKCHAGCSTQSVIDALGMTFCDLMPDDGWRPGQNGHAGNGHKPKSNGKAPPGASKDKSGGKTFSNDDAALAAYERSLGTHAAKWPYRNADGELVGWAVRWETSDGKTNRPIARVEGGWICGGMPEPRPLYRLPKLIDATRIYICEGEKACDAAVALGLIATTSAGGSGAAKQTDWGPLGGKEVVILPDHDGAGEKYAEQVARLAHAAGATSIKILRLPGLPEAGDIADLEITTGQIINLSKQADPWEPSPGLELESAGEPYNPVRRYTIGELRTFHPTLNPPVVDGLVREGETANIISGSKVGKSWLVYSLAISVVTGRPWLDRFETIPGKVLIIDNELHKPTIANRIPAVCKAMGVDFAAVSDRLDVMPLRGDLRDLVRLGRDLDQFEHGEYKLVIVDAWYRMFPAGVSENDNAAVTNLFNHVDGYAERLGAAFAAVHHSTKGGQSDKRVTDVGAGAGSQSRAADCHLVLREHENDDAVVLDAAVRSFAPVSPMVLRWEWPLWRPDGDADPEALKRPKTAADSKQESRDLETDGAVLDALESPATRNQIKRQTGFGVERVDRSIARMVRQGLIEETTVPVRGKDQSGYRKTLHARG